MPLHQPFAKKQQAFPIIRKKNGKSCWKYPGCPLKIDWWKILPTGIDNVESEGKGQLKTNKTVDDCNNKVISIFIYKFRY